ncbi:hypothetical protein BG015_004416 [Linnemannia schmuckeri]|uniref:Uncharacterized protein n=1 Tax=Linnemannia schmuckeri TaxID=64567 RepID=A0A9P5S403_9FUNG|nr:hypothetical protein BG015_004416 [Linnemannia schmuckeri]
MRFSLPFSLAVMVAITTIISFTSSTPIPINTNNNCHLVPRAWCQPQKIPEQPKPVKRTDAHDDANSSRGPTISYNFPIGEPCTIKSRTGPSSFYSNSDLSPSDWCPPQMLDPVEPSQPKVL